MHTYTCTHAHMHTCTHGHTHTHTHTQHTHTHTHTLTHKHLHHTLVLTRLSAVIAVGLFVLRFVQGERVQGPLILGVEHPAPLLLPVAAQTEVIVLFGVTMQSVRSDHQMTEVTHEAHLKKLVVFVVQLRPSVMALWCREMRCREDTSK